MDSSSESQTQADAEFMDMIIKVVRMLTGASGPDWPVYVKTPDHINVVSADKIKSEYGSG